MRVLEGKKAAALAAKLAHRGSADTARVEPAVRRIVSAVRHKGDRALRAYAERWDGLMPRQQLNVTSDEMQTAWDQTPEELCRALRIAADNIRQFAEWQKPADWQREIARGVSVGQIVRPLDSVGCYVPGGRYPLPSTLLMTVTLAQVAGVKRIVIVSPRPARETLAAAALLGIAEFYRIGGAQAISALAYGTKSVPRVHKIVGPGNLYVTTAKKLVAFDCAIDMLAGPTEAIIRADSGNTAFIAADLIAQAEHDADALAMLVTTSRELARAVAAELRTQSRQNPTARESLHRNGAILLAETRERADEWANAIAAEHITVEPGATHTVRNAGSVFVGDYSAQAFGDYCSGPNHVLPTGGAARYRGGLSVLDFLKIITVQQVTREGAQRLAPTALSLADAEGLRGHANSVRARCANA
jgi:histidinol dehydrogenase